MSEKALQTNKIKQLTAVAMFAALAYAVHFIHIPVGFLNLDFKDFVMTICGMYFGPISGLAIAVLVPVIETITVGGTGIYGLIMNVISSVTFVGIASVIYRFKKTLSGAVVGLFAAVFAMTAVMMLANLFITPYYMGVDRSEIVSLIPTLLLPFNAIKAVINASFTLCAYKPLTKILKLTGFGKCNSDEQAESRGTNRKHTVLVWTIGGTVALAALLVIFLVLGGRLAFN